MREIHVETEALPASAAQWAGLLPAEVPHLEVPPGADPASAAAAAGVAGWPLFHAELARRRREEATALVSAAAATSAGMQTADAEHAAQIAATTNRAP